MKRVIGLVFIAAGVALGLYVGIWWAFIGGIVDILNELKAPTISELNVAVGLAKAVFAALIGWLAALFPVAMGVAILEDS